MKNNFRVILAKKRKTVADLSKDTGISKTTLTNLYYERTKNPDSQTLLKLSKALGVTIDEILTVENWKQKQKKAQQSPNSQAFNYPQLKRNTLAGKPYYVGF